MDRVELAAALATARNRLTPAAVGLPPGDRRRVLGLRREEVAMLAGISVDYLVRLEQGRGPKPSSQVVGALARALRLGADEREHLFLLAGVDPPRPEWIDSVVRPTTMRLLDRLTDLPALVLDAKGDLLAWNALAVALLGDITRRPQRERNLARLQFLLAGGRVVHEPGDDRLAAETVYDLRAAVARYPDDPELRDLLDDLRTGSPEFARLWDDHRVAVRRSSRKTFDHPEVGRLTLDCDVLHLPDVDQVLVVYSAAEGTLDADALALLRVIGVQDLTS
jgi:transcriptional regulator with XRE-family HTH domain